MKKLIYIDPHCSGIQVKDVDDDLDLEQYFLDEGCGDYTIYYLMIKGNFTIEQDSVDFT